MSQNISVQVKAGWQLRYCHHHNCCWDLFIRELAMNMTSSSLWIELVRLSESKHSTRPGMVMITDQSLYLLLINYSEADWLLSGVSLGAPVSPLTWYHHTSFPSLIIIINYNGRWWCSLPSVPTMNSGQDNAPSPLSSQHPVNMQLICMLLPLPLIMIKIMNSILVLLTDWLTDWLTCWWWWWWWLCGHVSPV